MDRIRKRYTFFGDVQGVGFRFRARSAAQHAGATGWVKNEWDGSVTMELQGTEEQIEQVLQAVERGVFIHIERVETEDLPLCEHEYYFHEE